MAFPGLLPAQNCCAQTSQPRAVVGQGCSRSRGWQLLWVGDVRGELREGERWGAAFACRLLARHQQGTSKVAGGLLWTGLALHRDAEQGVVQDKNINKDPCLWKGEKQNGEYPSVSVFQTALLCHNRYVLSKGKGLCRL